jgi:hypothetical protein
MAEIKKINDKICAYTPVVGTKYIEVGVACWKERGYHPLGYAFKNWDEAQKWCDEKNKSVLNINQEQAQLIVGSSMFPEGKFDLDELMKSGKKRN